MNLNEGTRRTALFLGVVGAIVCGSLLYLQLQSAARPVPVAPPVHMYSPDGKLALIPNHLADEALADGGQLAVHMMSPDGKEAWVPQNQVHLALESGGKMIPITDADLAPKKPSLGGIGNLLPAAGVWSYVLIAIVPILGFFIPWAAIKSIGWVLAGFIKPSK